MYGLIGFPLGHSFSQRYFTEKFEELHIKETYSLFPLRNIDELPTLLRDHPELTGFNVTLPYKKAVFRYLDRVSEEAWEIGAVNVVKGCRVPKESGTHISGFHLSGYNTDWIGFTESLRPLLREDIRKALVLGTGGASKAVCYSLRRLGIEPLLVSRTPGDGRVTYADIDMQTITECPLIVNTTPLGMFPDILNAPGIPYHLLSNRNICFDLVYNPLETEFMKRASEHGAIVSNGLGMLYRQADEAWRIWNTDSPCTNIHSL